MRKMVTVALALAMLFAACGDDDDAAADLTDPASLGDCSLLADATIVMLQDVIDFMGDLSPEEFAALGEGAPNETLDEIAVRGEAIGSRAGELECSDLDAQVQERADQLTAEPENAMGQLIIEGTKAGQDVLSRLFR